MTNAETDYVVVGKLGSTHGILGWLKLYSFTEPAINILAYTPWYIEDVKEWKLINLEASREHAEGLIVKLTGYNNPEKARLLTNKKVAILRSQLPLLKKGDFYWSDLENLTVINTDGMVLGKVIYLLETGSNDVLVIKGNDKEHAIPYLPDVIMDVDLANQIIHVHWELI
jgi:16S rRNA processing protein RimM